MAIIGNPIYQSAFVTDQFSGDGTTTAFTMSVSPAGVSNVLVVVSGVVQDPSTYGVVGTTLNFTSAPPSGTGNISCRYLGVPVTGVTTTAYRTVTEFTATASQTTFTPPSYTVGFINVYRNGVLLGSADYTASNGTTVVLATGATAGDLVTVESFQVSSVVNAIQNTAGSVGTNNIATGAVTAAKLASGAALSNIGTGGVTASYLASGAALSNLGTSQLADANMAPGSVIQVVNVTNSTLFSTTSSSPVSTGISASITPSSSSSKILVLVATPLAGSGQATFNPGIYLYRGGSSIATTAGARNSGTGFTAAFNYLDSPATTSSTTYSLYIAVTSGTGIINDYTGSTTFITLMEIAG